MISADLFGYEPPEIGSTNDLRVHAKQIGECGAALTVYCLRNMGLNAYEVGDTCHYDITVDVGSSLLRVQVKSTSKSDEAGTFRFNHTKGHRSTQLGVRAYDGGDYDVLALVALSVKHVVFDTFAEEPTITRPAEMFMREGIEEASFRAVLAKLGRAWATI